VTAIYSRSAISFTDGLLYLGAATIKAIRIAKRRAGQHAWVYAETMVTPPTFTDFSPNDSSERVLGRAGGRNSRSDLAAPLHRVTALDDFPSQTR
jgi:hypothetical protein